MQAGAPIFFFDGPAHEVRTLHAHTRSHPEGGGDGGEYGDDDVEDFSPDVLVFHSFFILRVDGFVVCCVVS